MAVVTAAARPQGKKQEQGASVFRVLLDDILSGRHPPGAHLPAERELARQLGASRSTLREALRRLGEWRLVEARHGSGVVVRPVRDWSFAVLPAYLRAGGWQSSGVASDLGQLVKDLLALRRLLVVDVLRTVAARIRPGALAAARAAARRAWDARHGDRERFAREDLEATRAMVEAAGLLPAVWLLGDVAEVYLELAAMLASELRVPDDYLGTYESVYDALEAGDGERACKQVADYLERHDRELLRTLLGGDP